MEESSCIDIVTKSLIVNNKCQYIERLSSCCQREKLFIRFSPERLPWILNGY